MGGFLLLNPRSGSGPPDAEELAAAARERGLTVHVLEPDDDVEALARTPLASITV